MRFYLLSKAGSGYFTKHKHMNTGITVIGTGHKSLELIACLSSVATHIEKNVNANSIDAAYSLVTWNL